MSKPRHRHLVGRVAGALALLAVVASCATSPGNAETDRIADTVARAISSPRQSSANGFVRAALATHAGQDSRLTVVDAEELHATKVADPLARLVFQVDLAASGTGFSSTEPITACYKVLFSYYGVIDSPQRISCPKGATAVVPAPVPPRAHAVIPQGFDSTLTGLLAALPATPTTEAVTARVTLGLPAPGVDPSTGLQDLLPTVESAMQGADLGVSLWAPFNRDCLLGARVGGQVKVGRPSRTRIEPGELSCDPQTALLLLGVATTP